MLPTVTGTVGTIRQHLWCAILATPLFMALTGSTPVHDLDLHDLAGVSPRSHRIVLVLHRPRRKFPQAREQPSPVTTCGNRKDTVCIPARARHSCSSPPPPSPDSPVPSAGPLSPSPPSVPPPPVAACRAASCQSVLPDIRAGVRGGTGRPVRCWTGPMLRHTLLRIMALNILGDAMQEQNVQDSTFSMYTEADGLCSLQGDSENAMGRGHGTKWRPGVGTRLNHSN